MKRSYKMAVSAGLGVAVLAWGVPAALAQPRAMADLRADVNRDGRVDVSGATDERGEDQASVRRGALFLSNVDDDQHRCKVVDGNGKPIPDADIVACWDGADTVVNGPQDEKDLARLRSVPLSSLPADAAGTAAVTGPGAARTHLFVKRATGWQLLRPTDRLTGAELARGVELGIEATDIVRDAKVWDGRATVTLSVTAGGRTTTDAVTLRAAPVLTHHHLQPAQQIMASRLTREQAEALGDPMYAPASATFIADLKKVAGMPVFEFTDDGDLFPQDRFEAMYTSMPAAGGRPQAMRVLFLSHQQKMSILELYGKLRGPDVGVVRLDPDDYEAGLGDTLDSMGNLETIPPYSYDGKDYPAGRVIMGVGRKPAEGPGPGGALRATADDTIEPSPAVQTFLRSQNMQDPLLLDTSWTFVEHVDEFIQFLPADTPRGWRVAVADPEAGMKLLRDARAAGHGGVELLSGGKADGKFRTIDQYLNDKNHILAKANALAATKIAANVAVIKRETGVRDSEIVHVPTLFGDAELVLGPGDNSDYVYPLYAEIPAAINGVVLGRDRYLSTKQWGPVINGKDIFAEAVSATYRAAGMNVAFIDGWHFHRGAGEIHCGTNVLRDASQPWWR